MDMNLEDYQKIKDDKMSESILVVEDEKAIRKFIKINLEREGYNVLESETGEFALDIIDKEKIDLIVLDLMLPGINGNEICKKVRGKYKDIGIIMLTAKSQDIDKIKGLEDGADDYITKPFNPKELILRIKSILRRTNVDEKIDDNLSFHPFSMDIYSKKFRKNNIEIKLTPIEFEIIKLFIENPGKAFSRDEILNKVWGYEFIGDTKIVDVNIRRIRSKIEEDPGKPLYIQTIWGMGYRWKNDE